MQLLTLNEFMQLSPEKLNTLQRIAIEDFFKAHVNKNKDLYGNVLFTDTAELMELTDVQFSDCVDTIKSSNLQCYIVTIKPEIPLNLSRWEILADAIKSSKVQMLSLLESMQDDGGRLFIGNEITVTLSNMIRHGTIESLTLQNNNFSNLSEDNLSILLNSIRTSALKSLALYDNDLSRISDINFSSLCIDISGSSLYMLSLENINLAQLEEYKFHALCDAIRNSKLKKLAMNNVEELTDSQFEALCVSIEKCVTIEEFYVRDARIRVMVHGSNDTFANSHPGRVDRLTNLCVQRNNRITLNNMEQRTFCLCFNKIKALPSIYQLESGLVSEIISYFPSVSRLRYFIS